MIRYTPVAGKCKRNSRGKNACKRAPTRPATAHTKRQSQNPLRFWGFGRIQAVSILSPRSSSLHARTPKPAAPAPRRPRERSRRAHRGSHAGIDLAAAGFAPPPEPAAAAPAAARKRGTRGSFTARLFGGAGDAEPPPAAAAGEAGAAAGAPDLDALIQSAVHTVQGP